MFYQCGFVSCRRSGVGVGVASGRRGGLSVGVDWCEPGEVLVRVCVG